MKNTTRLILKDFVEKTFLISTIMMFGLTGFLSCVSIPSSVVRTEYPRSDSRPPVDAFGLVMIQTFYTPDECLPSEKYEECLAIISHLPPVVQSSVGSGLLVKAKTKTVFLTAQHVCSPKDETIYERDGIKINLVPVTKIFVRVQSGEEIHAEIEKEDEKKDLCALSLKKNFTRPIHWSRIPPVIGDKVYAMSAPMGINHPEMTLIFSGFYSGRIYSIHHYTIPTRPGSSGSIVLDKNFRGVGMLNAAYINMESIGIGSGYQDIKDFLDSI